MTWIHKKLQINKGTYGVLDILGDDLEFTFTFYSYVNCGGNHMHHNFTFKSVMDAIKVADILYSYGTSRKRLPPEEEIVLTLKQKYDVRGELVISRSITEGLTFRSAEYGVGGKLHINREQARKIAGYIFFWVRERLIGTRKEKRPAETVQVFDINDDLPQPTEGD